MASMLAAFMAAFVWLCAPALASSGAGAKLTGAQPLGGALQPNGTLRRQVHGSFNPRGYRLALGKGGAPRFVKTGANVSSSASGPSSSTSSPSDSFWSGSFGAVGLPDVSTSYAVAVNGANVYVGGLFKTIQGGSAFSGGSGIVYNNIAWWDGHGWRTLGTGTNGAVKAIAVSGSNVYVGGSFTSAGGTPANRIARWNGTGWWALGGGMTNTTSGGTPVVDAIAVSGSNVYAGGQFDDAGTAVAHSVAMWNGTQWSALDTGILECGGFNAANHCSTTPTNGTVDALLVRGSTLYAGGSFNFASGQELFGLAAWNGTSWGQVGGAGVSLSGGPGTVDALAASSTTLYVGGRFDHVGGTISSGGGWSGGLAVSSVAALTGTTWSWLGGGANGVAPVVTGLTFWSGKLFISGTFSGAGGDNSPIIGQWNGTAWSPVGPGLDGGSSVSAVLASGTGGVYALGGFSYGGGHTILLNRIGQWNGSAWQGLGLGFDRGTAGGALAVSNHNLYAAGSFTVAGWSTISGLAHFNGTRWLPMGSGVNGSVDAIAVWGSDVFVGGSFTQAGGVPASRIAMWNGSNWFALGGGTDGTVNALLVYKGKLWVGGAFQGADSKSAKAVATWTPTSTGATTGTWAPVGGNIDYAENGGSGVGPGVVYALSGLTDPTNSANNHYVAIGGAFQQVDDLTTYRTANNVVLFDTGAKITGPFSGYSTLGPSGSPGVSGGSGFVKALYFLASTLYVGGSFIQAGTTSAPNFASIAVFGTNGWTSPGAVSDTVWALTGYNGVVYLAGGFTSAGGQAANYVAWYTPATHAWGPLGSGLGVYSASSSGLLGRSLAQSADGLYVGGSFGLAGGKPASNLALWTGTAIPTVTETVSPTSTTVGSPVTFTATIRNGGSASAPGVTLTSTLPSSATFVSATPSQGTCTNNSGKLSCSIGTLAGGGGTATVAITLTPNATGSLSDSVTVMEAGFSNSASAAAKVN